MWKMHLWKALSISLHQVSTLVQKVHYLETELKDHKKFFKDVMGTLVKKVKALQVKLKTRKRKMVMSDSDQEDSGKQDVELDALRALANAAMTLDSNAPSGGSSQILATSPSVPTAGHTGASTIPPDSDDEAPPIWSALVGWEGDLQVLFDSYTGVLSMFADVSYPLSIKLMKKMLTHKLEIDSDVVGNDMTTA
nr:hypothetical protein [Tanacetum cinerariifolium]